MRRGIEAAALFACLMSLSCCAYAQGASDNYPVKPVRMVVPLAPGGATDIVARMVATKLSERLRRQFVVENRLGAGGTVAFAMVAKSAPDGYTLLTTGSGFASTPALYATLAYDPIKDFVAITQISRAPYLLVVHPSLPVRSPRELIALAKAKPGVINFGSAGTGSSVHFVEEMFRSMAGINLTHVPYKGVGDAVIDLISGQVQMMISSVISTLPHVRSGRLRMLAVSGVQRSALLPETPTVSESGVPGYDVTSWIGIMGPTGMPADIVAKIHAQVAQALKGEDIIRQMAQDGGEPVGSRPEQFGQLISNELAFNRKIVKATGMKIEGSGS